MIHYKKCFISRLEKNVIWAKLKETIIIIALKETNEKVFKLNETAAYIWEHCDGKKNIEELVNELCEKYAVNKDTALKDTIEFVEKMKRKNLIAMC
jgi:methyltransferase-like protein